MTTANSQPFEALHRILVVDDEEIVLVALRETLRREGYEVVTAESAVRALEILESRQFSVILTDQQMPQLTGLEFLAQVRQIQPNATRILITAVLSLSTVIDAINKGEIYRFIVKPWLREELLATVKNAMHRYELICRNVALQAQTQAMNEKLVQLNQSLEAQIKRVDEQNHALEQNLQRSIELCLHLMQVFYPMLGNQARRSYEISRAIATGLKLSPEQQMTLEISAWLHDIGLVGVPRQIIKRSQADPASLNEEERLMVEHHPVLGQELASFVNQLGAVGTTIRAHHERFDGEGYPDRLMGENISWLARLLAVVVAFVESPHDDQSAIDVIKRQSGEAFDPEAVRAFLRWLPHATLPRKEREVLLSELRPGMVLAKGIYTANGILLIPEGQRLSETYIDKLRNHNLTSPISQALLVYG